MKQRAMWKNLLRTVKCSLGRYLAIVCIIALGSSMFVGLLSTKSDMVLTGQTYLDAQNMFDLTLISTCGWSEAEVEQLRSLSGVAEAEGGITIDAFVQRDGGADKVYKLHSLPQSVSVPYLLGGRMPQAADECLIDGFGKTDAVLGTRLTISQTNDSDLTDSFAVREFTVVGYVSSPLYMDTSRGSTSLGSGTVSAYAYLPPEAFTQTYFTQIALTLEGDRTIYSEAYAQLVEQMTQQLEPEAVLLANGRLSLLKQEAQTAYDEGLLSYRDGLAQYEQAKTEAEARLEDARLQLEDGQVTLDEQRAQLDAALVELESGQATLDENLAQLDASERELLDAKAEAYAQLAQNYEQLTQNYTQVCENLKLAQENLPLLTDGIAQIEDGLTQIEDGIAQIDDGLTQLALAISLQEVRVTTLEGSLELAQKAPIPDRTLIAQLEQRLENARAELDELTQQRTQALDTRASLKEQQTQLEAQLSELRSQLSELEAGQKTLTEAKQTIEQGFAQLQTAGYQLESQFASARAQLDAGRAQLEAAQRELDEGLQQAQAGQAALSEAEAQLQKAREEYERGKQEAEEELTAAWQQLSDAEAELDAAREAIDGMTDASVYLLDRETNAGYLALDSNSDIVAGVARVFPAFFLLIAALVCITTMTRMIDEERTQIGTLKALGYGGGAIIGKYIAYAGSAAILGCGLGVLIGSVVFPTILWNAYCIILNIMPRVCLHINAPLCLIVVVAYTIVVMLVTWYCCRRALHEVPAQLMRPKPPTAGKKIFLEYLPFWKHVGFLNKVMLRNVLRYRRRMLMMLIGVGGCTALLLTGFGLKDSITNLVTDQFENVMTNDLTVYFSCAQTQRQQQDFSQALHAQADEVVFFYQTSVELTHDDRTKELYLVCGEDDLTSFMHFSSGGKQLEMPEPGEALLSVGVAENLGIGVGDRVSLTDSDMRTLEVTVLGVYHNSVYNYAIVSPETVAAQWGSAPDDQMAFLRVSEDCDMHALAAQISGVDDVMTVSVTQDIAGQVDDMIVALNAVVLTIVVCAGALAMIVLYDLTNINITERIREIATIKVLGFHAGETAAYVFKENLLLSALGVLVGLPCGWLLLKFVMNEIRVDFVWFTARLQPMSVLLGVVLTMLAACLVDFFLYFRLERINMAEALKSVE